MVHRVHDVSKARERGWWSLRSPPSCTGAGERARRTRMQWVQTSRPDPDLSKWQGWTSGLSQATAPGSAGSTRRKPISGKEHLPRCVLFSAAGSLPMTTRKTITSREGVSGAALGDGASLCPVVISEASVSRLLLHGFPVDGATPRTADRTRLCRGGGGSGLWGRERTSPASTSPPASSDPHRKLGGARRAQPPLQLWPCGFGIRG